MFREVFDWGSGKVIVKGDEEKRNMHLTRNDLSRMDQNYLRVNGK